MKETNGSRDSRASKDKRLFSCSRWLLLPLLAVVVILRLLFYDVRFVNSMDTLMSTAWEVELPSTISAMIGSPPNPDTSAVESSVYFLPGTLNMSRLESFRQCHVPRHIYGRNFRSTEDIEGWRRSGAISDENRMIYHIIGKSGSSSSRWIMENAFNATDMTWPKFDLSTYEKFTFTREPMDRFFSSFQEALYRKRPWGPESKNKFPFAYLYTNLSSDKDWFDGPCDDDCYRERFERFITEHDQLKPFDVHLHLQVGLLYHFTRLVNKTRIGPYPYPLDAIYSTETLIEDWQKIAAAHNVTLPKKSEEKKRAAPQKIFDPASVSVEAQKRICRFLSLDYCCLNYQLPDVCEDAGVSCVMHSIDGETRIESANVPGVGGIYETEHGTDIKNSISSSPVEGQSAEVVDSTDVVVSSTDVVVSSTPETPRKSSSSEPLPNFPHVEEGSQVQFQPGTLNATRLQVFRQCHVSPDIYHNNFQERDDIEGDFFGGAVSDVYRLMYYFIPKAGSSSSRYIMDNRFAAKDREWPSHPLTEYEKITFTREPLDRFFSSFQEALLRKRPWGGGRVKNFPFSYLYTGLSSNDDLSYTGPCDGECFRERFERFVTEYDPMDPFDVHLNLQVPMLHRYMKYRNGTRVGPRPYALDAIYSTETLNEDWEKIAASRNVKIFDKAKQVKRPGLKLFDTATASDDTKKRICRFLRLDYCCLNYRLPDVCEDAGVSCTLRKVEGELQIEPTNVPGKGGIFNTELEPFKSSADSPDVLKKEKGAIESNLVQGRGLVSGGPPVVFKPGSLNATRLEVFRQCHVPGNIYWRNFQLVPDLEEKRIVGAISDEYRMIYHLIGKSGSSSSRWIMENAFNATDFVWPKHSLELYTRFTFTREPMDRFFSSFQEALYRKKPWGPERIENFPFPYLYTNISSDKDWFDGPCDDDCHRERFERFITEHDQLQPFDVHLRLQVGQLFGNMKLLNHTRVGPYPYPLDAIYSTETLNEDWQKIAAAHNVTLPKKSEEKKRAASRKIFDPSSISDDTKKRICRMLALDFCCLNYPLPDVCEDSGVSCIMRSVDGKTRIEPAHVPGVGGVYGTKEATTS